MGKKYDDWARNMTPDFVKQSKGLARQRREGERASRGTGNWRHIDMRVSVFAKVRGGRMLVLLGTRAIVT